tara:strand:+ start:214 stop:720 length:507 start_codon:yes stop_codon:yes gene_type:complete
LIKSNPLKTNRWYLLQTKYKQERRAAQELNQQNVTVFLPMHRLEKITRGNKVITEKPLFSSYLFANLDLKNTNWTSIRSTRGIINFVAFGNGPVIINQSIIEELRRVDLLPVESYFNIGDEIRITRGSLKGLNAIYKTADGASRSHILLKFMQQNQYLSISNDLLEKM